MNILFVVEQIDTEHLGIMQLSAVLRRQGHHVTVTGTAWQRVSRALCRGQYGIVAFSTPTVHFPAYRALNRKIKGNFRVYSVFGGPHPTFAPEIIRDAAIDCLCRGEGEGALTELADVLARNGEPHGIQNLYLNTDAGVEHNPVRPLIADLDSLPFPDRALFPHGETFTKGKMHVMTSRGCPYQCAYCSHAANAELYGAAAHRVRRRGVGNILEEIKEIRRATALRLVMFEDDLFTGDREWLADFCARYAKDVRVPFFCYVRADTLTDEMVAQLKTAGCVSVSLGVETVNRHIREAVLRRHLPLERIRSAAAMIKRRGLRLETTNIIGIPGTTLEDDFATMDFNRSLRPDYASVKMLMPYPGTPLRRRMEREGYSFVEPLDGDRLAYACRDPRYRRNIENFRWLFGLGAAHEWVRHGVRYAVRFAGMGAFYRLLFGLWEGYTAFFRLYPTGVQGFWWGLKKYLRRLRVSARTTAMIEVTTGSQGSGSIDPGDSHVSSVRQNGRFVAGGHHVN